MKRILVLFLLIAFVIGSIYAWMVLRPRPSNLLRIALRHATEMTVVPMQATFQWEYADETERNYRFGGWASFAGLLDARDFTSLRGSGVIGYSSTPNQADIETANLIVTKDRFEFQEKKFKPERSIALHAFATGTDAGQWYTLDRQILLNELGYSGMNTHATESELRKALKQVDLRSMLVIASSSEQFYGGRGYMSLHLRIKEDALMSVLLTLGTSWKQEKLTDKDIIWIKQVARDAAHGDWYMMVDESTGDMINLTGQWYSVDAQERILGRNVLSIVFGVGGGESMNAKSVKNVVDLTEQLFPKKKGALPASGERVRLQSNMNTEASSTSTQE